MNAWYLICFLSALAIFIAFANQFILKMQTTIAITTGSVVISLLLILAVKMLGDTTALEMTQIVSSINFNQLLLKGMLGFLLFAGALEINLAALRKQRWEYALVLFNHNLNGHCWLLKLLFVCFCRLASTVYLLLVVWCFNQPNRPDCSVSHY